MVAVTLAIIRGVVESEEGSALWALISCVRHLNGGGMTGEEGPLICSKMSEFI